MKLLIKLNLSLILRIKGVVITTTLFALIAIFQAIFLKEYAEGQTIGAWDYLLLSVGGIAIDDNYIRLHAWIIVIVPILFYVYHLIGVTGGYDLFVLSRVGSRFRWFAGKYISLIAVVLVYGVWYGLVQLVVGAIFFPFEPSWGGFIQEHFRYILDLQQSPAVVTVLASFTLISGMVAFCTLAQACAIFFRNSNVYYVILTILMISLYEFYAQGLLPREFSPLDYTSFISLIQLGNQGLSTIIYMYGYNIIFSLVWFMLGLLVIRSSNLGIKQE